MANQNQDSGLLSEVWWTRRQKDDPMLKQDKNKNANTRANQIILSSKGLPQAVLKIHDYAQTIGEAQRFIGYVEKKAEFGLEDEKGQRVQERVQLEFILKKWLKQFDPVLKQIPHKIRVRFSFTTDKKNEENRQAITDWVKHNYPNIEYRIDRGRGKKNSNDLYLTLVIASNKKQIEESVQKHLTNKLNNLTNIQAKVAKKYRVRNILKMVLSSPPGTDPKHFEVAVRSFLKQVFACNQRYLFGIHTDTAHPHAHVAILVKGRDGKKIDPKKADLHHWRQIFARHCLEQGILVDASYRSERGVGKKNECGAVYQMRKKRGIEAEVNKQAQQEFGQRLQQKQFSASQAEISQLKKNLKTRVEIIEVASQLRKEAHDLQDPNEQKRTIAKAAVLEKWAKDMPVPRNHDQEGFEQQMFAPHEIQRMARNFVDQFLQARVQDDRQSAGQAIQTWTERFNTRLREQSRGAEQDSETGRDYDD